MSKYLYTTHFYGKMLMNQTVQKWENEFQGTVFSWNEKYNMPCNASIDITIQSFQSNK